MDLLLDTHVLLWWRTDSERLPKSQARLLAEAEDRGAPVGISAVTLWERGRLEVDQPLDSWLEELERNPLVSIFPVSARIALESVRLGDGFHQDPADQIIVATARCPGLRLLTADDRIIKRGKVRLG